MLLLLSFTVVHDESCVQESVREAILYYQTERRREDIDHNDDDRRENKTNYNILHSTNEEGIIESQQLSQSESLQHILT